MKTKSWNSVIPQTPKVKHRKYCYNVLGFSIVNGTIVWLTGVQLTMAYIRYPDLIFLRIEETDLLEYYKKYEHINLEDIYHYTLHCM